MYDYFVGKVISIAENFIILEVNNIGYKIFINNKDNIKLNYFIKIYIYNHITDSMNQLYGFTNKVEKDVFIKLLEVKKIGVKSAFIILKKYNYDEILNFIFNKDEESILRIPKITKDNYQSFIQKLSNFNYENVVNINSEFLSILRSLEYEDREIFKVYKKIDTNNDINTQVKEAIRILEGEKNE